MVNSEDFSNIFQIYYKYKCTIFELFKLFNWITDDYPIYFYIFFIVVCKSIHDDTVFIVYIQFDNKNARSTKFKKYLYKLFFLLYEM